MTYATVAPFARLPVATDELTYTIAADQLAAASVGRLVTVPLRGRRIHGVLTNLQRHRPSGVIRLVGIGTMTPIIIPAELLELARAMRRHSWQPLGLVLASLLPPPLLRWTSQSPTPAPAPEQPSVPKHQTVVVVGPARERARAYDRLIERAATAGRSALLVFAHRSELNWFLSHSRRSIEHWDSSPSRGARWQQWQRIAAADQPVAVAGLRSAVSAPVSRLGLIIVDTPRGRGQKDDQAPYADTLHVAALRSRATAAHLVVGDDIPLVTAQPLPTRTLTSKLAHITLLPSDPATGSLLQAASERWLLAGQSTDRTFIFLNRLGAGSLSCRSCGNAVRCSACQSLPSVIDTHLRCRYCGWAAALPNRCPRCGNPVLTVHGSGTERTAAQVATLTGQPVAIHDQHHPDVPTEASFVVGTEFALPFLADDPPDRALILGLDLLRQRPTYDAGERTLRLIQALRGLSLAVAIETGQPTDPWFATLESGGISSLLDVERHDRRQTGYPPFVQLVRLTSARLAALSNLRAKLEREPRWRRFLAETTAVSGISGPVACRDQPGHQLILRLPLAIAPHQLLALLDRAGALSHVTVDVDPTTDALG